MTTLSGSSRAVRAPRQLPIWAVAVGFWALVVAVIAIRRSGVVESELAATFGLVFASIAVEALPFILIGALVSAAMAAFVPDGVFSWIGRLPRWLQVPGLAVTGVVFPVCECGSVPVARRLIARGVHPSASIAFMLAAPVINPIVLGATWVAYGGGTRSLQMVVGRALLGLAVAVAAGFALARDGGPVLRAAAIADDDHDHEHAGSRRQVFAEHLAGDFLFMGRFLVLGAALSALLQTVVPQGVTAGLGHTPVLGALVLMGLAFMLSLCSEADAFVAASFTAFPLPAQLAFLAFGPVADTKLAVLYSATFRGRFVLRLLLVAVPACLAGSLLFAAVT
ncbi:MAG: uncharacterized protein QOE86_1136 [Solirubrobacteraceae bacterium]|nr:uncharacterized protein [Solirubrobacteraceae bacterium]